MILCAIKIIIFHYQSLLHPFSIINIVTRNKKKIDIKTFISFFVFIFQLFFDENLKFVFINSYSLFYIKCLLLLLIKLLITDAL